MGSLSGCIAKAGALLSARDRATLNEAALKMRAAGGDRAEAEKTAVAQVIESLRKAEPKEATKAGVAFDPRRVFDQAAYHGSPYRFTKFTLDHLGKGEGTQVFGHGLYFASLRDVAEFYRGLATAKTGDKGQMYKVEIPEDTVLLDRNAAHSKQPDAVRAALEKLGFPGERFRVTEGKAAGVYDTIEQARAALKKSGEAGAIKREPSKLTGAEIYTALSKKLGGDKAASDALLDAGVLGLKYLDAHSRAAVSEGRSHNYVIFRGEDVEIRDMLYQGAQQAGPLGGYDPASNTMIFTPRANLSTALHESAHHFLELSRAFASAPDAPAQIKDDFDILLRTYGVKGDTPEARLADWNGRDLEAQRAVHERFATEFERYLFEGKAPTQALQPLFSRFRTWMVALYQRLMGSPQGLPDLSPEVRGVMDRMLASEAAIKDAEASRAYVELPRDVFKDDDSFEQYRTLGREATESAIDEMSRRSLKDMRWLSNARSAALREIQARVESTRREVRIAARRDILQDPVYQAWQFLTMRGDEAGRAIPERRTGGVDPRQDSLVQAIAKLGGIDRESARRDLGIAEDVLRTAGEGIGKPAFRKTGGKSADDMRQSLEDLGYLRERDEFGRSDLRGLADAINNDVGGQPERSWWFSFNADDRPQGFDLDVTSNGKLSTEALRRIFGTEPAAPWRKLSRLGMTSDTRGVDPEVVAISFGFDDARHMVESLASAKPPERAIEEHTDRLMLIEHGDLVDPKAIDEAANAAVHNGARARFLATGLKVLTKSPVPVAELVRAAKETAAGMIGERKIGDLRVDTYLAAERRANKEVLAKVAKDPAAAIEAQRQAMLASALAREAGRAIEEVGKAIDHLRKVEGSTAQSNMRGEALDQMNELLARFDLRKSASRSDRKPLPEWLAEETERLSAVMPDLPPWVLDDGYRVHYRELTVDQLRGLRDSVKQLEMLARREQKQYMAVRGMEFAAEQAAILNEMRKTWADAFDESGVPKRMQPDFVPTLRKSVSRLGDKFAGEFLSPETIITILGGGKFGVVNESLFGRLTSGSDYKANRLAGIYKSLKPVFDQYSIAEKLRFGREDIATPAGIDTPLTRENAVVVALLYGSKDGRDRLANYGWNDAKQRSIVELLDARDMRLVNEIWRLFDKDLWPELRALNERTRGKSPPKVEALPYKTAAGDATGGYFRLKYDTALDERAMRMDESDTVKAMLGGSHLGMSAKTAQGSSVERVEGVKLRPRLDLNLFAESVTETVHDLAYREAVADTVRMLNNREVSDAIKQIVGVDGYRALLTRVREVAAPPRNPSGYIEKTVSVARRNTVVNLMSGVLTAMQNLTGLVPALMEVNAGHLASEVAKFYSPQMADRYRFAIEHSEFMANRFSTYERDLQNNIKALTMSGSLRPDTATFLALMGFVDRGVSVPVWNAAFKGGMEKFGNDMNKAIEYADHVVRQTQGSGRDVDLAQIMGGHGGWGELKRAFTMFYSYFNSQLGLLVKHGVIDKVEARTNPGIAAAKFTAAFMAIVVIPNVLTELLMRGAVMEGESEEEAKKRWAGSFVKYGAGMFPFVRDVVPGIWARLTDSSYYGTKVTPLASAAEGVVDASKAISDYFAGTADEKDMKKLIMGVGYILGLPGKLVTDVVDGTRAWLNGEAGPQAILVGPPKKP